MSDRSVNWTQFFCRILTNQIIWIFLYISTYVSFPFARKNDQKETVTIMISIIIGMLLCCIQLPLSILSTNRVEIVDSDDDPDSTYSTSNNEWNHT